MVCNKCGAPLETNAKFCTSCGASVTAAAAAPQPAPTPTPAPAPAPEQKKSGVKPLLIVLIVLAAVILIALVVVACLLLGNRDKQPANNENDFEIPEGGFSVIIGPDGEYIVIGGEEGSVSGENPVPEGNPYRDYYNEAVGYILPDSAERYYARADLENLSPNARKIAFNEIFARRGYYGFQDIYMQEYFEAMPWYERASVSFTLNNYELANAVLLDVMVREQEGTLSELNNPYLIYRGDSGSELVYDSADRYLHADDLEQLTLEELTVRRAEILARHGVIFKDQQLQEFFSCKRWYVPSVEEDDFDLEEHLNDYEACNIQLIQLYMDILNGECAPSADNKYIACYDPNREEILPQSATVELTYADLRGLTEEELAIARNEIICRYGYVCGKQELVEYFLLCSWYRPSYAPLRSDLVDMTLVEYKNMETIYNYEKDPSLGDDPAVAAGLLGSWMLVGEKAPAPIGGYTVTTRTFNSDGTYSDFSDLYEFSSSGWHQSGLADSYYRGEYARSDIELALTDIERGITPNLTDSGEWEWEATGTGYNYLISFSEDGNYLYLWKDGKVVEEWLRVIGSTSEMMNKLYPTG